MTSPGSLSAEGVFGMADYFKGPVGPEPKFLASMLVLPAVFYALVIYVEVLLLQLYFWFFV
jgi:hypothetical protein